MSKDISELELPLPKVIDLGRIDSWLRGLAPLVPKPAKPGEAPAPSLPGMEVTAHDFNSHMTQDTALETVRASDIERMVGLRNLLAACSQANVCVEVSLPARTALEVSFKPEKPFFNSRVFGTSYQNVLPVIFDAKLRT